MNLLTNSAFMMGSGLVLRALSMVLIPILSRTLGTEGLGKYYFSFYLLGFLTIFSDLGLGYLFVRKIASEKQKSLEHFRTFVTLRLLLAFLFLAISVPVVTAVAPPPDVKITVYLLVAGTFIQFIYGAFSAFMQAYEHFEYVSVMLIIERVLVSALTVAFILKTKSVIGAGLAFLTRCVGISELRHLASVRAQELPEAEQ